MLQGTFSVKLFHLFAVQQMMCKVVSLHCKAVGVAAFCCCIYPNRIQLLGHFGNRLNFNTGKII